MSKRKWIRPTGFLAAMLGLSAWPLVAADTSAYAQTRVDFSTNAEPLNRLVAGDVLFVGGSGCTVQSGDTARYPDGAARKVILSIPDSPNTAPVEILPSRGGEWFHVFLANPAWTAGTTITVKAECKGFSASRADSESSKRISVVAEPSITTMSAPRTAAARATAMARVAVAGADPHQEVRTEFRLPDGTWSRSQLGTTDSNNQATMELTYGKGTADSYTWRTATTIKGKNYYSREYQLTRPGAMAEVVFAPGSSRSALTPSVRIAVPGSGAGARVTTQFWVNKSWSTSQVGHTNSSGEVVLPLTYGKGSPGAYIWRASASVDGTTVVSKAFTLNRTS